VHFLRDGVRSAAFPGGHDQAAAQPHLPGSGSAPRRRVGGPRSERDFPEDFPRHNPDAALGLRQPRQERALRGLVKSGPKTVPRCQGAPHEVPLRE